MHTECFMMADVGIMFRRVAVATAAKKPLFVGFTFRILLGWATIPASGKQASVLLMSFWDRL